MTENYLKKQNLAGVIVLYNPDSETVHNIASYIDHISHLYVVDNSESPSRDITREILNTGTNVTYHPLGANLGIATALNRGCEIAMQNGYEWLLTMDQDSHFGNGDFFHMLMNKSYSNVAIIAASYNNIHFMPSPSPYAGLLDVSMVITSGNVLNLAAWEATGRFTEKFFIDEVDNEFCIRAINRGFMILATTNFYLLHKLGEGFKVKHFITGSERVLTKHSPLRVYYAIRNNIYIWRKFMFSNTRFVANRVRNILTLLFKIIVYFPDKKIYFKYIRRAIGDSIKSKYGKFTG